MKRDEAKQLAENGLAELKQALVAGKSEALQRYLTVIQRTATRIISALQESPSMAEEGEHDVA